MDAATGSNRQRLMELAFHAWQVRNAVLAPHMREGHRPPSLSAYLRSLGLESKAARTVREGQEAAERKSAAAAAAVREAFKRRGVIKSSG